MSFVDDFDDVTRAVARLVARQYVVAPADLEAAAAGHGALVQLLQQLHQDVTGLSPHAAHGRGVDELERHPVALLGRLLSDQPRLPSGSLTDLLAAHRSPQQLLWTDLARTATLAHHEWTTSDPRSYPAGDGAWTVVGAVARIAEVLPALDDDLAASFEAAGREVEALQLRKAGHGGLAPTAREVAALAGAGSDGPIELVPREPRQVIVVLRPSDLPAAMRRAASLIEGSRHLSPQHLERLAVAHARTMLWIADGLERHAAGAEAAALRQDARVLAQAARMPRRLASIQPSDAAPLAQLSQIRQALVNRDARRLPAATLMNMAALSPAISLALANVAGGMVAKRHWLTPSEAGSWAVGNSSDPTLRCVLNHWNDAGWAARQQARPESLMPVIHGQAPAITVTRLTAPSLSARRPSAPTGPVRGAAFQRAVKR